MVIAVTGESIELVHTDAEGRLLLADTLALASRLAEVPSVMLATEGISSLSPALLIDFATLTGLYVDVPISICC